MQNWTIAKKALQSSGFMDLLKNYDKKLCTPELAKQLNDHINAQNLSDTERLKNISRECAKMMEWVNNLIIYIIKFLGII